jgi:peroxiredoxin
MPLLNTGDPFPQLTINTTDGQALTIPDAFAGDFAVVLFNRGAWCPFCTAQLRAFERASATLAEAGIRVVALSVDDKETAAEMAAENKLTFPVGYGADAPAVSALTGAFVNPDPVHLQSTGFVLDPRVTSSSACTRAAPSGGTARATPRRFPAVLLLVSSVGGAVAIVTPGEFPDARAVRVVDGSD